MDDQARMRVAVFRPADDRLDDAVDLLESLGADPVADPMLAVEPTGAMPRDDADYVVFTSKTGVELVAGERGQTAEPPGQTADESGGQPADGYGDETANEPDGETDRGSDRGARTTAPTVRWEPGDATVVAIGEATADVLEDHGYAVDIVPKEYSSAGLVDELADEVAGATVEVARSDHGSDVLLDGLADAGATVHETVLYRLKRPDDAGESVALAADEKLDAAIFSSSLTVENFLAAAADSGVREAALDGLGDAVVGVIGEPTRVTAEEVGIDVDVVPDTADFEALACLVVENAAPTYHE